MVAICIRPLFCILGIASLGASAIIEPPKNDPKPAEQHKPWRLTEYCELCMKTPQFQVELIQKQARTTIPLIQGILAGISSHETRTGSPWASCCAGTPISTRGARISSLADRSALGSSALDPFARGSCYVQYCGQPHSKSKYPTLPILSSRQVVWWE